MTGILSHRCLLLCGAILLPLVATGIVRHIRRAPVAAAAVAGSLVCEDPIWDIGTLDPGMAPDVSHSFVIRNISRRSDVTISEVHTSCGCIAAEPPDAALEPGATAALAVRVVVPVRPGPFRHKVVVAQQDHPDPLTLQILGTAAPSAAIRATPSTANFGTLHNQESVSRVLRLDRFNGTALEVGHIETSGPELHVDVQPTNGEKVSIVVRLAGSLLPPDRTRYRGSVSIASGNPPHSNIRIPVVAEIDTTAALRSSRIFIDALEPGTPKEIDLLQPGIAPAELSVRYEGDPAISVERCGGDGCRVRVAQAPGCASSRLARGTLRLYTVDGQLVDELAITALCVTQP